MQVNNSHNYQYNITTIAQTTQKNEELRENRENLHEINNQEILRIKEEINTSSTTGLGANLNITT